MMIQKLPQVKCQKHPNYNILFLNKEPNAKLENRCQCQLCDLKDALTLEYCFTILNQLKNKEEKVHEMIDNGLQMLKNLKQKSNSQRQNIIENSFNQITQIKKEFILSTKFFDFSQSQQLSLSDLQLMGDFLFNIPSNKNCEYGSAKLFCYINKIQQVHYNFCQQISYNTNIQIQYTIIYPQPIIKKEPIIQPPTINSDQLLIQEYQNQLTQKDQEYKNQLNQKDQTIKVQQEQILQLSNQVINQKPKIPEIRQQQVPQQNILQKVFEFSIVRKIIHMYFLNSNLMVQCLQSGEQRISTNNIKENKIEGCYKEYANNQQVQIASAQFSKNQNILIIGEVSGLIKLIPINLDSNFEVLNIYQEHKYCISQILLNEKQNIALSVDYETIIIWKFHDNASLQLIKKITNQKVIQNIYISNDDQFLAVFLVNEINIYKNYSTENIQEEESIHFQDEKIENCGCFIGINLLIVVESGCIKYDLTNKKYEKVNQEQFKKLRKISSLIYSSDYKLLIARTIDSIRIFQIENYNISNEVYNIDGKYQYCNISTNLFPFQIILFKEDNVDRNKEIKNKISIYQEQKVPISQN